MVSVIWIRMRTAKLSKACAFYKYLNEQIAFTCYPCSAMWERPVSVSSGSLLISWDGISEVNWDKKMTEYVTTCCVFKDYLKGCVLFSF